MSAWLRKTKGVPGSAPGGYQWPDAETAVEVHDDALAVALLEIPDAGFVTVPAPEEGSAPEKTPVQEGATAEKPPTPEPDAEVDAPEPESKPARKGAASKTAAAKTTPQA